jgi:UDP-N-acetylmuramoyl-L-alanyl-D-glutamate--2,6-diaminopimelate ligase
MKKTLAMLVKKTPALLAVDERILDKEISLVTADSRQCQTGSLFVATKGAVAASRDGHDFIDEAMRNGAHIIVANQDFTPNKPLPIPLLQAKDSKVALGQLAEAFYDSPSTKLSVIGITGTNGKTSTSFMLHSILQSAGYKPAVMGTLGMGDPDNLEPLSHTTMDPEFISKHLARMNDEGITHVIMEVSSHALSLKRVDGIRFAVVALTNISQDHLDFHETLQAYRDPQTRIIFPHDHPFNRRVNSLENVNTWGDETSKIAFSGIQENAEQTQFLMRIHNENHAVRLPFLGHFHVKNACLSAAIARSFAIESQDIIEGLARCPRIPGRLEPIKNRHGFKVFVDFAHTPHALSELLSTLKLISHRKIILVFGCGGDRDVKKRPIMGVIAKDFANIVIVTDDNPRSEDPATIRAHIMDSMSTKSHVHDIADRRSAIEYAIKNAQKNDIVVIAGKGHENYQIYGNDKRYFSDHSAAQQALDSL